VRHVRRPVASSRPPVNSNRLPTVIETNAGDEILRMAFSK